jgi:hypothetical protein
MRVNILLNSLVFKGRFFGIGTFLLKMVECSEVRWFKNSRGTWHPGNHALITGNENPESLPYLVVA